MAPLYDELKSLGDLTFLLAVILLVLSWITVSLRVWVRFGITKTPGWDDAAMVFTLCLYTCYIAFILVIVVSARKLQGFTLEQIKSLLYVQLSEVFYILTTTFLKTSLGLFFLRLLTKPWQRYLFNTILVVSAAYGLFYFLLTVFVCGNPAHLADSLTGSRSCIPMQFSLGAGYLYGVINVIADWTFTLVPILILIESDMDARSKISISIVIAFAAIGSVSSIMRMVYLKGLQFHNGVTPTTVKATIWATAEPGTGIVASSVAILRPLFRKIATDVRTKITDNGDSKAENDTTLNHPQESEIGMKSMDTTSGLETKHNVSIASDDPWEERTSYEQRRYGGGRPITITVGAGEGVEIVSPIRL